jgi:hypothetical protein
MSLAAVDADLADAREAFAYWDARARDLPRYAVRRRREARELAARWRRRVADAERTAYGAGVLGALLLFATERRLPAPVYARGRVVAHRARQVALTVLVALLALAVAGVVAAVEIVAALLRAVT